MSRPMRVPDPRGSGELPTGTEPSRTKSRGGLCGTLAVSLGRGNISVELNIGRSGPERGTVPRLGTSPLHHFGVTEDDLERARRALFAVWQAKKKRAHSNALNPSLEVAASMDSSGRRRHRRMRQTNFWDCLDPDEKNEFRSIAIERTFARGARLIGKGESADHVIVILQGRTKICVDDDGTERVIAERGPGQLIGERAALQVSVRSASVIVLDRVQALVVRTEDFASFVSAHSAVLEIVESQVYERLTEDTARGDRDDLWGSDLPVPTGHVAAGNRPEAGLPRQREPLNGENCTVVVTDVAGFGALHRTNDDRRIIRGAILEMTRVSLEGIWDTCSCEDRGDGLLIISPPAVPTARVLDCLRTMLPVALRKHNRTYAEPARIQLRVAVDVGPVISDDMGVSSDAVIRASRMRDAPVLKEAMDSEGAVLGIIVSDFVYEAAVRQGSDFADPARYRTVAVTVKETVAMPAWMELVGPPRISLLRVPLDAA